MLQSFNLNMSYMYGLMKSRLSTAATLLNVSRCCAIRATCVALYKPQALKSRLDTSSYSVISLNFTQAMVFSNQPLAVRAGAHRSYSDTTDHVRQRETNASLDERYDKIFGVAERKAKEKLLQKAREREAKLELQKKSPEEHVQLLRDRLIKKNYLSERDYAVVDIIRFLVEVGIFNEDIDLFVRRHLYVFRNVPLHQWQSAVGVLQENGFRGDDLLFILTSNRKLFGMTTAEVNRNLYGLRQVFSSDRRLRMLCTHLPILINMPIEHIEDQFAGLKELFTAKDLYNLLDRTPAMFLDDINETKQKLNYVLTTLNVPEKHVAKTYIFKHSLQHIMVRSEFLLKSGIYIRPNKHGHSPIENASLREILDTTDDVFCTHIARCSQLEYQAYCDMFQLYDTRSELNIELQAEKDDLDESEDEYDSDEEDLVALDDDDEYFVDRRSKRHSKRRSKRHG